MDYNNLLDIVEIIIGVYVVYLAFKMKSTKKLEYNALISKSINLEKAKDPMGYINATFLPDVICGGCFALCGVVSRISEGKEYYYTVQNICMVVSVIILLAFGYIIVKSQRKYLEGK